MTRSRATLQDIARASNCSVSTVSRILNAKDGHFSVATRNRVLEAVRRLGYRVNAGARATRKGRQGCVTLVMSAQGESRSYLPEELLRAIHDALESRGLRLNVAFLPDARLTDPDYVPRILTEWTSDGLLVNYNKLLPPGLESVISSARVPAVWLNLKRPTDACYPDDYAAGRAAADRYLAMGHRRIVYCSFSFWLESLHYSEVDRRQGYVEAMQAASLEARVVDRYTHPTPMFAQRTDVWREILSRPDRPTAVITYGISSALHVVRAADRLGLVIPRDLSVCTFGVSTAFAGQDVDTFLVPEAEMGRQAVEMLLAKLTGPEMPLPSRPIPYGVSDAGSSAPATPGGSPGV